MHFENVSILSLSYVDAPHRVTTRELEDRLAPMLRRLGIRPRFLERLTGIRARRFWDTGVWPSTAATHAAEQAIQRAGIDRSRIGILISTSVSKDYVEPSVACFVHGNLELSPQCLNFDVGNACLAFLNGIHIAATLIDRGQVEYALIVDGENSRYAVEQTIDRLLDPATDVKTFKERFATLTLGSGAAAMVLARADLAPAGHRLVGGISMAATQYNHLCVGQHDYMKTDARGLLHAGMELAKKAYPRFLQALSYGPSDLGHLILHQVSRPNTEAAIRTLDLDADAVYRLYPEYGNIGPAGIPIALAKSCEEGNIAAGDRVALMGIGSGLNCAILAIDW